MRRRLLQVILIAFYFTLPGFIPQSGKAATPEFPSLWLNSPPVNMDQLRGKLVVLYFYEEQCPSCRAAWPEKLLFAKKYADKPVVFIAVNSGTAPDQISSYAREVKLNWPIIADVDRRFEQAAGIHPISLQNIMQLAVITPKGDLKTGNWSDWEGTIERYVGDAHWRVDPAEIPEALKPAWQNIELGNYGAAAAMLVKMKKHSDKESQLAVKKLAGIVKEEFSQQMADAKSMADEKPWAAFQRYRAIAGNFQSLPQVKEAVDAGKKLAKDETVVKEQKAAALLRKMSSINIAVPAGQKRAEATLQAILKDYPETEAGARASQLLGKQ